MQNQNQDQNISVISIYCDNSFACINECFVNNNLKNLDKDNNPLKIEVPKDLYNDCLMMFDRKVYENNIQGITARNILKQGLYTFAQAKNLAKLNKIEGLYFDSANNKVFTTTNMGISAAITYALSFWNGFDLDTCMNNALLAGLNVCGTDFIKNIFNTSDSLNISQDMEKIINNLDMFSKVNTTGDGLRSEINQYGATALCGFAALTSNPITMPFSVFLLSGFDIADAFSGKISGSQLFKNMANTASAVAGAAGGFSVGATIGSIIPVFGTIVGGIAGSLIGATVSRGVSDAVLSSFIEDDAVKLTEIIQKVFVKISMDYVLGKKEVDNIIENISAKLNKDVLQQMHCSTDKVKFAAGVLLPIINEEVSKRQFIFLPNSDKIKDSLTNLLKQFNFN